MVSSHYLVENPLAPQTKFVVRATMRFENGKELQVSALIDTGAEVCIVRRGLVTPEYFVPASRKRQFLTADARILEGGYQEVPCDFILWGGDVDTGRSTGVVCPGAAGD